MRNLIIAAAILLSASTASADYGMDFNNVLKCFEQQARILTDRTVPAETTVDAIRFACRVRISKANESQRGADYAVTEEAHRSWDKYILDAVLRRRVEIVNEQSGTGGE